MKGRVNQVSVTKTKAKLVDFFKIRITEMNSQTLTTVYYIYLLPVYKVPTIKVKTQTLKF
jgi:hypothetical protein